MPKIAAAVAERARQDNVNIDLSSAENWLIRLEIIQLYKDAIAENLNAKHLSYPNAFGGDADVLGALASFFNRYFNPHIPVETSHLSTTPGAASCIDALLYNICDPGDGVLVPGPYWNALDFLFRARNTVTPLVVSIANLEDTLTEALLPALEEAFDNAPCPVKALVLTNPHNPLAQAYPQPVLEGCLKFCHRRGIHLISDEIYALTSFKCPDIPNPTPFVSALSLDSAKLGCDSARIHVVWSTSKDFGQSGIRMGCTVSQNNKPMAVGLTLAANTQTSCLSAITATALLTSPKLNSIIATNSKRLAENYQILRSFLTAHSIRYFPCYAGLYVFAKMARDAQSWDDELRVLQVLRDAGVVVTAGRGYHGPDSEVGWMRVGFAIEKSELEEAVRRMHSVYIQGQDMTQGNQVITKSQE